MTNHHINYAAYAAPDVTGAGVYKRRHSLPFFLMMAAAGLMVAHIAARPSFEKFQQGVFDVAAPVIAVAKKPVEAIQHKAQTLSEWAAIRHDNEALRAENEKLKQWYQSALMLESENKALRDLLNAENTQAQNFITTRVLADASSTYAKSLVVEGGKQSGVSKGEGVVSHEGLLGRVIETGSRTARVLLLQDINSRIPVIVEGSNERAILAGTNEAMPVLDHLASGHKVLAGARVVTSGLGGLFPYGIPVGETVINRDGSVSVALYASPERAQFVQVVDYGIKPLLNEATFSASASASTDSDSFEPN